MTPRKKRSRLRDCAVFVHDSRPANYGGYDEGKNRINDASPLRFHPWHPSINLVAARVRPGSDLDRIGLTSRGNSRIK